MNYYLETIYTRHCEGEARSNPEYSDKILDCGACPERSVGGFALAMTGETFVLRNVRFVIKFHYCPHLKTPVLDTDVFYLSVYSAPQSQQEPQQHDRHLSFWHL
ncbi:MAG: hypothetical protein G01um101448_806 [Parcubacteria group bacterium Gr01-1014_48]|nr:MAG: hypothetical protein Greene041614_351 [Parcubacteria group bacterium Greene0416_14]TSC73354.1 MAG: hypothetical protein G01um101448_806 [Parcubacteria group bacterium Gr01-1014_48]TSD01319.1 MAG: hypothetical protein Greene101415_333 [Parcubacteria group bacterium Greene1014_15]TSD08006.1 MAG: hypothetical protein Greene07144_494 [Parcubacteria group bacterium Greene0714_4]